MPKGIQKLIFAVGLMIISILLGSLGFHLIEGYTWIDSFFMAVITISTVGFATIDPLEPMGKIFASLYIILNLVIFAYVISVLTSYLFEGGLRNIFRKFIIDREVNKMKDHVIVCGYGRNGSMACKELKLSRKDFVVIENDEDIINSLPDDGSIHLVVGDATDDDILKLAKIDVASYIILTLPRDSDNVFITLTARELNPDIHVIARASDPNSEKKLIRAGAHNVILPDVLGGLHMSQLITKPYVIEFLDLLNGVSSQELHLEEIEFEDIKSEFHNKTIGDLDVRAKSGVSIIGVRRGEKGFAFNPGPDTIINMGSILIVLGNNNQIEMFSDLYLNKKILK
jgi:voltage-gated potassium channel